MTATIAEPAERESANPAPEASCRSEPSLFPLPLSPFERYVMADDRLTYPMTSIIEVELDGEADREALNAGFAETLTRHPLLTARMKLGLWGSRWVGPHSQPPALQWRSSVAERQLYQGVYFSPTTSPAVQAEVLPGDGATTLVVLVHHAGTDGVGAFQFIGDVLACYGRRVAGEGEGPKLLSLDPELLKRRATFDLRFPDAPPPVNPLAAAVYETWKVLSRRPLTLPSPGRPPAAERSQRHELLRASVAEDVYQDYCGIASELDVTVNDLLLRDLFLTIHDWGGWRRRRAPRGWLRVNVPTSLRGKRDIHMPATNILGYALITKHTRECQDPSALLTAIASDTAAVRAWNLGAMFVDGIRQTDRIPGFLRVSTRLSRRFATAVLSNLGDPTRRFRARFPRRNGLLVAGNLTLRRIVGAPPVRPGTRAALALFTYANRFDIGLRVDPRWFSAEAGDEFLAAYVERLLCTRQTGV